MDYVASVNTSRIVSWTMRTNEVVDEENGPTKWGYNMRIKSDVICQRQHGKRTLTVQGKEWKG